MADETQERLDPSPTDEDQYAATRLFEPEESLSRQEDDIALAAELLESGIVTEREIATAVSDWSIHGSVSLAQHFESRGLLTTDQIAVLRQSATRRVERDRRRWIGAARGRRKHVAGDA